MDDLKNWMWLFSVFVIASLFPVYQTIKNDKCEYDIDFTRNFIKVVCNGSTSMVNVYAENAHVTGDNDDFTGGVRNTGSSHNEKGGTSSSSSSSSRNKNGRQNGDKEGSSRRRTNKQLPGNGRGGGGHSGKMSADHGSGENEFDFSMESSFSRIVWKAKQKLDTAKRNLTNYAGSLKNMSEHLHQGDLKLRSDMDKLKKTSNHATELKHGITVAMTNTYNFMESALRAHDHVLSRVVNSLDAIVDVTSDGLLSALNAHNTALKQISHLNTTLHNVRRKLSAEYSKRMRRMRGMKKGNISRECPKKISAIGSGHARKVGAQAGAYMVESYTPNAVLKAWIIKGTTNSDQIIEYDSAADIDFELVGRYYALPFSCHGTGHAVFRRNFYCHEPDTNRVIKYNLKRMDIVSEVVLPGTQFSRYPYKSGQHTDVDLAVDEFGLWAIYATAESKGKIVISKINHQKMEVGMTWTTDYYKANAGNAFMICGVLYVTASHSDTPTFISYEYNTQTSTDDILESGQIPFANSANLLSLKVGDKSHNLANSVMLSYDFRSSVLYSWSNSHVESFPVYFHHSTL